PADIKATAGDSKVTFSWTGVEGAERYSLSIYDPNTGKYTLRSSQITKTTYTTSKLTNGKQYQFLIRAYVDGKWSPYTSADFVKATPYSTKPANITATAGDAKVTFSWNAVPNAERYSLSIYDPNTGKYTLRSSQITRTTYTTSKLTNGKQYQFLIRAYVNGEWSPYTTADFVKVTPGTGKPADIKATAGNGKVTFSWTGVEGAERYSLSIYNPDTNSYTLRSSKITRTTYTASALTNGKQYQFLIRAYVNGEWSPYTSADFVKVTPKA
ncbi:MAG: fibronectin type III domain-containing protein, partial [Oscillospiraceae bacterium]|nr:fibronectin type III domain-containing protein [Oscillospiraceae bacterium]